MVNRKRKKLVFGYFFEIVNKFIKKEKTDKNETSNIRCGQNFNDIRVVPNTRLLIF